MDPLTISLIAGLAPQVLKIGQGAFQKSQSKRMMEDNIRPTYSTPDEINQLLAIAKNNASLSQMPGRGFARQELDVNVANAATSITEASSSSAGAMAALTNLHANRGSELRQMAFEDANFQLQQDELLKQALELKANYTDKEFNMNELIPFQDTAAAAGAMYGAGTQNMFSGIEGIGMTVAQAGFAKSLQEDLLGSGGVSAQPKLGEDGASGVDQLLKMLNNFDDTSGLSNDVILNATAAANPNSDFNNIGEGFSRNSAQMGMFELTPELEKLVNAKKAGMYGQMLNSGDNSFNPTNIDMQLLQLLSL